MKHKKMCEMNCHFQDAWAKFTIGVDERVH